jgi:hypothetical protein
MTLRHSLLRRYDDIWTFEQLANEVCATYSSVLSKKMSRDTAKADVRSAEWQRFPTPGW